MRIERTVDIDAPPESVYKVVMDPHRLYEWVSIHEDLPEAPAGELKAGSTLHQRLKIAGQRFSVRWRVVEDDCPRRVVWEGQGPIRTHAQVIYSFERRDGGTRFAYVNEYEIPGGAAGRFAGRAVTRTAEREMDRSLDRLKALLES